MDDIAVTALAYASSPLIYSSLIPRQLPCSIDVGKYVVERQQELADEHANMVKVQAQAQADAEAEAASDALKNEVLEQETIKISLSNVNSSVLGVTTEPKTIVEDKESVHVDEEPLIQVSTIGDKTDSQDAVSRTLFSDTLGQEEQTKAQRPAKTSNKKRKK
jgi:hypothetical protein